MQVFVFFILMMNWQALMKQALYYLPVTRPIFISSLQAYPNPTTGKFTISFYSKGKKNIVWNLSTEEGRILFRKTAYAEIGMNKVHWNIGGYAAGVYVVWDNSGAIKIRIAKQ